MYKASTHQKNLSEEAFPFSEEALQFQRSCTANGCWKSASNLGINFKDTYCKCNMFHTGGPGGPACPGCPLSPSLPSVPGIPCGPGGALTPGIPGSPGRPSSPGRPWKRRGEGGKGRGKEGEGRGEKGRREERRGGETAMVPATTRS